MERSSTLREQVVAKLRGAIVAGEFGPGSRLIERHMCEFLEVSRTLVREALRQLEAEGWVRILPNRGPVVASITPGEVRELYEVRAALEGMAALRAAELATPEHFSRLSHTVDLMQAAQRRGDPAAHRQGVHDFYEILREAAGNSLLRAQLAAMSERMAWLRGFTLTRPERAAIAVQDEKRLLDALTERDADLSRRLCETQLRATGEAVVATLEAASAQNIRTGVR